MILFDEIISQLLDGKPYNTDKVEEHIKTLVIEAYANAVDDLLLNSLSLAESAQAFNDTLASHLPDVYERAKTIQRASTFAEGVFRTLEERSVSKGVLDTYMPDKEGLFVALKDCFENHPFISLCPDQACNEAGTPYLDVDLADVQTLFNHYLDSRKNIPDVPAWLFLDCVEDKRERLLSFQRNLYTMGLMVRDVYAVVKPYELSSGGDLNFVLQEVAANLASYITPLHEDHGTLLFQDENAEYNQRLSLYSAELHELGVNEFVTDSVAARLSTDRDALLNHMQSKVDEPGMLLNLMRFHFDSNPSDLPHADSILSPKFDDSVGACLSFGQFLAPDAYTSVIERYRTKALNHVLDYEKNYVIPKMIDEYQKVYARVKMAVPSELAYNPKLASHILQAIKFAQMLSIISISKLINDILPEYGYSKVIIRVGKHSKVDPTLAKSFSYSGLSTLCVVR